MTKITYPNFSRNLQIDFKLTYLIQGPCRQSKARSTCAPSGPKQLSTSKKYHSQFTSNESRATFLANVANSGHNREAISHICSRSHRRKIRRSRRTAKKSLQAIKASTCNFLYANTNGFKSKVESMNQIILEESNFVDRNKSLY